MPHILVEYSANVGLHHDIAGLVHAVHDAGLSHGLAKADALRTRAERRDIYAVADRHVSNAFVAIHVAIGPGRDAEQKTSFITCLLDAAESFIDKAGSPLDIAWSIELREIDAEFRINRNHVRAAMAERDQD